ncbi:MAG: hypothetical protein ABIX37_05690 [Gammaproteobacteria bacterium]
MAAPLSGTVAARLKAPPPLGTMLRLESSDKDSRLLHGDTLIGEARVATLDLEAPAPPAYAQAEDASRSYSGFTTHPFPGCFVCGPARERHDGLRIFPGSLGGSEILAAPWVPDMSLTNDVHLVRPEFLWSALDCSGGMAVMPRTPELAIVLGELCASITGVLAADERCVVMGWPLGGEGRKRYAGSAVYGQDGRVVGLARAVWLEVATSAWA